MASDEALDVMLKHGFRHLPVVEGRELMGHRQHPRHRRLPDSASLETHVGLLLEASGGAVEAAGLAGMRRQGLRPDRQREHHRRQADVPGGGCYHASNHALEAFSDALGFEVRPVGD